MYPRQPRGDFGGAMDYYRTARSGGMDGGMPPDFSWKPAAAPSFNVGDYTSRSSGSDQIIFPGGGLTGTAMGVREQYATKWGDKAKELQMQMDAKAAEAAQQHNFDMAKLAYQAKIQQGLRGFEEDEAFRGRDHALLMQARGFENDDYSNAKQAYMRYGLGSYF